MSDPIYALLIGAGFYFPNITETGTTYPSLRGCVRDIMRVEEELLIGRLQVPRDRILKLKASDTGKDQPDEPREQWPTYDNIVAKFQELIDMAPPGSQVYIHYSGHGGRATSRYKEVKGQDGIDEAIVPIDIEDVAASRYVRDLELARLLKEMVDKGLMVTLVLDCCHSGGLTRGGGHDIAVRGGFRIDKRERPRDREDSLVAPQEELIHNWRAMTAAATRSITASSGWLPEPRGYVMLAACKENELAVEYAFNGTDRSGALTYWLLHALQKMGPHVSWKQVHDRILGKINSQFVRQTPQLEGEAGRQVFGLTQVPPVYAVRVLQYDSLQARVELNTGQALGAAEGAGFAIFPVTSTDFTQVTDRLAVAEIAQLGATTSWARITESITPLHLHGGEQAVMIDSGVTAVRGRVRLIEEPPPPPAHERAAALQAVEAAMAQNGRGFLVKVGQEQAANYQVAISQAGEFEILDAQGTPFANLQPALKINAAGAAAKVIGRLTHLYKYHTIEQLKNPDIFSPLAGALTVKVFKAPLGAQSFVAPAQPPEPLDGPGDTPLVAPGDRVYVLIKNSAALDLNIAMLDLDCDWTITQTLPPASYHKDTWLLESQKELWLVVTAKLPPGYTAGRDILKVFATVGPASFRYLELPALDQQFRSLRTRGRTANGALEQLLAVFNDDAPRPRSASLELKASTEWTVGEATLHIR